MTQLLGTIRLRMDEDSPHIDVHKQRLGASPNFVHSMDACHLMYMLLKSKEKGIECNSTYSSCKNKGDFIIHKPFYLAYYIKLRND